MEVRGVSIARLNEGPGKFGNAADRDEWVGDVKLDAQCLALYDSTGVKLAQVTPNTTTDTCWISNSGRTLVLTANSCLMANTAATFVIGATQEEHAGLMQQMYNKIRVEIMAGDHFDRKIDKTSSELYFHYYGMLQHQQNMLQDYIRTGTYHSAITENKSDFTGKAVMDVGCGSGILSLFAAQAGARVVYAVEASKMAQFAEQLAQANPEIGNRIRVLHGKVEEVVLPEKVDVLVSEPMGTLLVNERMLESYIYARDRHLKPGGLMFPSQGRIYVAAFSDYILHAEIASKAGFWQQESFYGVDLTCLARPAARGYFTQAVVDQIPSNVLVSNTAVHSFDFLSCTDDDLQDFTIPLSLQIAAPCMVHGIAAWFDVLFQGSTIQKYLSTAPGLPVTHWFQLRCVLEEPLQVSVPGVTISGSLRLVAHAKQSYDLHLHLQAPPAGPGLPVQESYGSFDLKEPYYRQLVTGINWPSSNGFVQAPGNMEHDVSGPESNHQS